MSCFHWFKLISVLIHLKYLYYNTLSLELSCLSRHPSRISPWPTEIPLQLNLYHVLHQFPYLFLPSSITRHSYWIYQTICQDKPIKFIIKLYTYNDFFAKHATYQKKSFYPIQAASRDQWAGESYVDWHYFNPSLLSQSIDTDNKTHNHLFLP